LGRVIPERTCIACLSKKPKWELIRIVRTPGGNIEVDMRGKRSGRGAYLCKNEACWVSVLEKRDKKARLSKALKVEISEEKKKEILRILRGYEEGKNPS